MTLKHAIAPPLKALALGLATLAALGLSTAAPKAAQAQSFTVTGSVAGAAPTFTYSYVVAPTAGSSLGLIVFNFADTRVVDGLAPAGFVELAPVANTGIFEYLAVTPVAAAATFTFTSPDGVGGTLGAANVSTAPGSSGVASVSGVTPAPAPEPSQTAALGVGLLGLSALALKARKRGSIA